MVSGPIFCCPGGRLALMPRARKRGFSVICRPLPLRLGNIPKARLCRSEAQQLRYSSAMEWAISSGPEIPRDWLLFNGGYPVAAISHICVLRNPGRSGHRRTRHDRSPYVTSGPLSDCDPGCRNRATDLRAGAGTVRIKRFENEGAFVGRAVILQSIGLVVGETAR
jgi:hypothetical protein